MMADSVASGKSTQNHENTYFNVSSSSNKVDKFITSEKIGSVKTQMPQTAALNSAAAKKKSPF